LWADCQGVIPGVTSQGTLESGLPQKSEIQYQPFLRQKSPCSRCHIFLMGDFTSVKPRRDGLFRSTVYYTSIVSVCHTLSRDTIYTFKISAITLHCQWLLRVNKKNFVIQSKTEIGITKKIYYFRKHYNA
jgi:hypothetical protein